MSQLLWLLLLWRSICAKSQEAAPEQVHLALGDRADIIVVTWVTLLPTNASIVLYGTSELLSQTASGSRSTYVDGGTERRVLYNHRVTLTDLLHGHRYYYKCGDGSSWSKTFTFRALPDHPFWSPRLAIFGDMGITNNLALPELVREIKEEDNLDVIIHNGDFAYDMDTNNSRFGDIFMKQIEPIASAVPYMTTVGNHEQAYNFSNYRARFSMPGGDGESQYYSFNIGPAHVISFSSEFYYYLSYGWRQPIRQYDWLERDLKDANKPENRQLRPWIIALGHRPMYCSNNDDAMHCDNINNIVRTGFPYGKNGSSGYSLGLEDLFYQYGVDIIIGAHEHSYERFWPVYNRKVCNGTPENPYLSPPAPVHIVTGSAGCSEGMDPFNPGGQPWSAFRSDDYGFTRMHIHNKTHLSVEQISVQQGPNGVVIDSFTIVNNNHGKNQFTCHVKPENKEIPWSVIQPANKTVLKKVETSRSWAWLFAP
ncbi:Acid phosphatase type 7 [Clonorchis sinensis]|uniref:Purple acid phosphatase n=1 Tax=Clonorchis sinensis TaxID=79923 RepID=A0A419PMK3_CLOSI|nr:Acid phosphatase type 7 [Clonorchis sinensis]